MWQNLGNLQRVRLFFGDVHRISTANEVCDQGWVQQDNCGPDLMLMASHGALR